MSDDFYRVFEEKNRGSIQDIKQRLSVYLPFITTLAKIYPWAEVADIGCGRGEWLESLRDNAIPAMGVDLDEGMLERALQIGLDVKKMDCLDFLQQQEDASLLVITGFHIAEHLPFEVLQSLVQEALRVLKPGGLLILETPNPENVSVGSCSFYMDPTHKHPLPPGLLEFISSYYGFLRTKILRLQEKTALKEFETPVYLIDVLKGVSPDYALIAQKVAQESLVRELDPYFGKEYGVTLDGLSDRYDRQLNKQLTCFQNQLDKLHHELMAVHASNSWRLTYPLRWIACQARAVRDAIKVQARQAVKKCLTKMINTILGLFHEYPKFRDFVLFSASKLGVYRLLQSIFRRVVNSAPKYHFDPMANEQHTVYQENMTSRAIDIYEQLKNENSKKTDI